MSPQELQAEWLKRHKPTKCKCAGYQAKRKPTSCKSTHTTDSTCIVHKYCTPTVHKRARIILIDCISVQTKLEQEVAEFTAQRNTRRTQTVNAMLQIFGE